MNKILLIAPPYGHLYGRANIRRLRWGFIPYGLASIAGKLNSEGHNVKIIDATCLVSNWSEIEKIIKNESPHYLGIGITTPQTTCGLKIAEITKKIKPDCITVVGGPHASALPEEMVSDKNIDIVVTGEGEITMSQVVKGVCLTDIKGIYYKKDNCIVKNHPQELIDNLDTLPLPLYEQLPIERYGTPYMGRSVGIITGRGCAFSCSFCASRVIFGNRCRFRSIGSILEEITWFKNRYDITTFSFWDDTFTIQKDRVEKLCEQLIVNGFNIRWSCTTRVDTLSLKLLRIMKKAGCYVIHLGIESGDEFVLEKTRKGITIEQVENAVKWAQTLNMETYGYFILGLPYESRDTLGKTIKLAKKLKLDYAQFALLTPLPGTEIWELAKQGKVIKFSCSDLTKFSRYGKAIIELPAIPSKVLNRYYRKAYFEFYFRWNYICRTLKKINSLQKLFIYIKMFLGFLNFIF